MKDHIRIGSRGSALALWQANWVKSSIEKWFPDKTAEIIKIKTTGDKILDVPLAKVGGKGLFVKEIEEALLDGRIDLAVHSMKDVPAELPGPLVLEAITEREDARDVLISKTGKKIAELHDGASIGTSSLRRQSQILNFRSDFQILQLRGNVNTRIDKAMSGDFDAIILAAAGVKRLGWADKITEYIDPSILLPAIGQGALGIEIRKDDLAIKEIVRSFNHDETSYAVRAERAFLRRLEGGCQVPIAAYGTVSEEMVNLEGLVADIDGKKIIRHKDSGIKEKVSDLGKGLAEHLLSLGADTILKEIYK